jgi:hypothetical protein
VVEQNDSPSAIRIFLSYSHKDRDRKDEVIACLGALPPDTEIEEWADTRMRAGDKIDETIFSEIEQTDLFLALISRYYLNSDYCRKEMKTALRRAEERGCRVVPVIVRKTESWRDWPIGQHLALPPDGKAPSDWKDPDEHWHAVELGLRDLIKEMIQAQSQAHGEPEKKSLYTPGNSQTPIQPQIPIKPPQSNEFDETVRKALADLFSNSRLAGAVHVLLGSQDPVEPVVAADELFQMEPLEAVSRWTEVVEVLYGKVSVTGDAQRDTWALLESVHSRLLPRLVDVSRLAKHHNFPNDALLFTIASPHDPPNRPIELLFARMNRNRVVQFEQRGHESVRDTAVPSTIVDVTDDALLARSDPDIESAVEQIGFELMKRFYGAKDVPEQMGPRHWKKLNASLKAGRHGVRGFYMVIPHSNRYADPAVLAHLYRNLPNLPKFLMAEDVGEDLPFVCDPVDIDAAIEEFWHLKTLWCGNEDNK